MLDIQIRQAKIEDIKQCCDIIFNCDLKKYYPTYKFLENSVEKGIINDEFFVSVLNDDVIGLIWFNLKGAFTSFPYLHVIAVDNNYQNCGVGKQLIQFYENYTLKIRHEIKTKSFLVVADFNNKAHEMYQKLGYEDLFSLNDLFRKGITETFMVKDIKRSLAYE